MSETLTYESPAVVIGRYWFKFRGYSPLPIFLLLFVLPPDVSWSKGIQFTLVLLLVLAEMLRIWAVGYAGSVTRTRDHKVYELVEAGPFRGVRNPLYVANIVLYVGTVLLFGFKSLSILAFIYFLAEYTFIVAYEEDLLAKTFGPQYLDYCSRVSRWIPRWRKDLRKSSHRFDLKKALRSERGTFIAMCVLIAAYYLKLKVSN